jgi:hypothetical protein
MPNPARLIATLPNPSSYSSTLSGVMTDNVTGLMWQQPLDAVSCAKGCTQADAAAYCASISLGNYHDWRLPTRIELVSLVDFTRASPAIDPVFTGTPPDKFWTSSSEAGAVATVAWLVDFVSGSAYVIGTLGTSTNPAPLLRVRCVRG